MFTTHTATLGSDVTSPSGTINFSYDTGYDESMYAEGGHKLVLKNGNEYSSPGDFTVAFDNDDITVTWKGGFTISTGTEVYLQANLKGETDLTDLSTVFDTPTVARLALVTLNLGAPDALDADGVCQSQSNTDAHSLTINGALATDGVATFDVPRNVIVDSGGADTATLTITGTDVYGNVMVEEIQLNGATAVSGKKAFKTVTAVASDGTISNDAFVGTGDVLGLPVYLPDSVYVLKELEDGASASSGTVVAGINSTATATTGDVRGTYDPNSACDGAKQFALVVALEDPTYKGAAQYAG